MYRSLCNPDELLSPLKVGPFELANRIVLLPLTCDKDKLLINDVPAGLVISEGVSVSPLGCERQETISLFTQDKCNSWKPAVKAIHDRGGRIFLSLCHQGRQSESCSCAVSPIDIVADEYVPSSLCNFPRALGTEEIAGIVKDYVRCASLAKEAGFDGVEVDAANGGLIESFLQASSNTRTDIYGGKREQRFRILADLIEALLQVYPSNQIAVKLSPNGATGSADNYSAFTFYAAQLNSYNLAYLHMIDDDSILFHNLSPRVRLSHLRAIFHGPIIGNVGHSRSRAESALRTGSADLVALGPVHRLPGPLLAQTYRRSIQVNVSSKTRLEQRPYSCTYSDSLQHTRCPFCGLFHLTDY